MQLTKRPRGAFRRRVRIRAPGVSQLIRVFGGRIDVRHRRPG
jgi:hypothetical protein